MFPKARVVADGINEEAEQVNTLPDRQETEITNGGSRASDLVSTLLFIFVVQYSGIDVNSGLELWNTKI